MPLLLLLAQCEIDNKIGCASEVVDFTEQPSSSGFFYRTLLHHQHHHIGPFSVIVTYVTIIAAASSPIPIITHIIITQPLTPYVDDALLSNDRCYQEDSAIIGFLALACQLQRHM